MRGLRRRCSRDEVVTGANRARRHVESRAEWRDLPATLVHVIVEIGETKISGSDEVNRKETM